MELTKNEFRFAANLKKYLKNSSGNSFVYCAHCTLPCPCHIDGLWSFHYFVMVVKCQLISINVAAVAVYRSPILSRDDRQLSLLLLLGTGPATATNRWPLQWALCRSWTGDMDSGSGRGSGSDSGRHRRRCNRVDVDVGSDRTAPINASCGMWHVAWSCLLRLIGWHFVWFVCRSIFSNWLTQRCLP